MTRYYRFPAGGGGSITGTVSISGGTVGVTGSVQTAGLTIAGLITIVSVNNTTWTALPLIPLAMRNAMSIQNRSGQQIALNYSSSIVGYVGILMDNLQERFYDITQNIVIYAKSSTSTCNVTVEELS